jgi:hypothetical protein
MPARWIGLFGVGLGVVGVVGWLVAPLDMPADDARALAAYYEEHRGWILAAAYAGVVGTTVQLVFFGALAELAQQTERARTAARIGLVSMVVEVVGVCVAFAVFAAVAYREPALETAQVMTDLAWILIDLAAGPCTSVGLMAFGLALAWSGVGGRALVAWSAVVAVAHLVVAAALASDGAFAPDGAVAYVVPFLFFSWFAVAGIAVARR